MFSTKVMIFYREISCFMNGISGFFKNLFVFYSVRGRRYGNYDGLPDFTTAISRCQSPVCRCQRFLNFLPFRLAHFTVLMESNEKRPLKKLFLLNSYGSFFLYFYTEWRLFLEIQGKVPEFKRCLSCNRGQPYGQNARRIENRKQNLSPPARHVPTQAQRTGGEMNRGVPLASSVRHKTLTGRWDCLVPRFVSRSVAT